MAVGFTLKRQASYVLERERELPDGEAPTVWKLRYLTAAQFAEVADLRIAGRAAAACLRACVYGIADVQDFIDESGARISHEPGNGEQATAPEFLDRVCGEDLFELGNAIYDRSELTPKKKP